MSASQQVLTSYGGAAAGKLNAYLTDVWALYSCLYLLRTAYAGGPLIRVRHTGTTTETDIGHNASGFLDTSALATAAAGGTLTVKTFYDQSGSARDIVQATTASQPRIVNSGTFDKSAIFDGVDDSMETPALPGSHIALTVLKTYSLTTTPVVASGIIWEFPSPNYIDGTNNGAVCIVAPDVTGPPDNFHGTRWLTGDGTNTYRADMCIGGSAGTSMYYFDAGSGQRYAHAAIMDRGESVNANQIKVVTQDGAFTLTPGPNLTSPIPSNNFSSGAMHIGGRTAAGNVFAELKLQNLVIYTVAKSVADMTAACALIPLYT